MALDGSGHIAIAELIFWSPAFFILAFIAVQHGLSHHNPWIFASILGLTRIISGATTIAYEQQTVPSSGLVETALITGALGISLILIAFAGLQTKIMANMSGPDVSKHMIFWPLYMFILTGLVLTIIAIVDISDYVKGEGSLSSYHTGYSLFKAATILFLVLVIILAVTVGYTISRMHQVQMHERRLVLAVMLALPFLLVRVLESVLLAFVSNGTFDIFHTNVWVQGFMQIFEEMAIGLILIIAGLTYKQPDRKDGVEMDGGHEPFASIRR